MKPFIVAAFPRPLAQLVISAGKSIKRIIRYSKRWQSFGNQPFIKIVPGLGTPFKITLNPFQNGTVDEVIATTATWENAVSIALTRHLIDGGVFLDIGGNIGYHSLLLATDQTHKNVQVHTFEPLPQLCAQIQSSIEANNLSNLTLYNVGLGTTPGEHTIFVRRENIGGSSLAAFSELTLTDISSTQTISIVTLDSFLPSFSRVDLIKIDVEGFELEALKGGQKLLETFHPVIVMEFSPMFYTVDYPKKAYDLIHFLRNLGYTFHSLDLTPIDLELWLKSNPSATQIDIVCK